MEQVFLYYIKKLVVINITEPGKKIKFGVMCSGTTFRAWQSRCILDLISMENVELTLLIVEEGPEIIVNDKKSPNPASSLCVLDQRKKTTASLLLGKFFNFVNSVSKLNLFSIYKIAFLQTKVDQPVDLSNQLKDTDRIFCRVIKKGNYSQYFQESDIKKIQEYDLDFILRFGFNIIRGDILTVPRYGVWSFHHDDEEKYRGGPACFWEIFHDDPVSGAILQKLTDVLDGGIVLRKGLFKTNFTSLSKNMDSVYSEAAKWPAFVVRDIQNNNALYLENPPSQTRGPIFKAPTNIQFIHFLIKMFYNGVQLYWQEKTQKRQWNIGVIKEPIQNFLNGKPEFRIDWYPLTPTENFFLADPFGIEIKDTLNIFCERGDLSTDLGEVVTFQYEDNIFLDLEKEFHDVNTHLSYPYIFEYNGEVYLVPESRQTREISLYKAEGFPKKWKKVVTIADNVDAVDSTIIFHNNLWWLFYTDQTIGTNSSLCILYAENLFGPWRCHSANPVKQDIRSARPAGTPFIQDGILYRPSQDCSRMYGGKIIINKVISLTPEKFFEEPVCEIDPFFPFVDGIHTITSVGNYTLIDGARYIR